MINYRRARTGQDSHATDPITEGGTPSVPSTSGKVQSFKPTLNPNLVVTDDSGRKTRSKSPVAVPASLICMVNSQYVRLQKLERISGYINKKKDTAQLNILVTWKRDVEETSLSKGACIN